MYVKKSQTDGTIRDKIKEVESRFELWTIPALVAFCHLEC